MYNRNDPRFRRRLNQISQNLESANENAQANLFTFAQNYVKPCFASLGDQLRSCQSTCFPTREERHRRGRLRSGARAELNFDFYDDWLEDEHDALLAWDNEEDPDALDPTVGTQPQRQSTMTYGTRGPSRSSAPRQKPISHLYDSSGDPTVIPSQSYFGFLTKLPFKIGTKGLRYKPSAADLQERPGFSPQAELTEGEALLGEYRGPGSQRKAAHHARQRSQTQSSGRTEDSYSSRGDIFPSDDEADAVPLDEEFTMTLARRVTDTSVDEVSGKESKKLSRKKTRSRGTTRSTSDSSNRSSLRRNKSKQSIDETLSEAVDMHEVPSLSTIPKDLDHTRRKEKQNISKTLEQDSASKSAQQSDDADEARSGSIEAKEEIVLHSITPDPTSPIASDSLIQLSTGLQSISSASLKTPDSVEPPDTEPS